MTDETPPATLWEALDLDAGVPPGSPPVVAIVGGGGKTALLYRLGREAARLGRRAVLAGTARFTMAPRAAMPPLLVAPDDALPGRIRDALRDHATVVATPGHEPKGRLAPIAPGTAARIAALDGVGLLALEADGSKMRPFKAPGDHEPAIPPAATHVVAVVGLDALDAPLDEEHVHRPERVRAVAREAGLCDAGRGDADRCDADLIARVLASPLGGRKGVEGRRFAVLVNKADLHPGRALALARAVRDAGVERVVVASLRDEADPVHSVLASRE